MSGYTEKTINLPFRILHNEDSGFSFAPDVSGLSGYYGTLVKASQAIKQALAKRIREALTTEEHHGSVSTLACVDGTVLVVRFVYGSWCYSINGPSRKYGPRENSGEDTREKAEERARSHAAQCYGGIAWECGTVQNRRETDVDVSAMPIEGGAA